MFRPSHAAFSPCGKLRPNCNPVFPQKNRSVWYDFHTYLKKLCYIVDGWGVITLYFRRLRDLREDHDRTQAQLSKMLFCAQQTYWRYENGVSDIPVSLLIKLADYYQVSLDYLVGHPEKKHPGR